MSVSPFTHPADDSELAETIRSLEQRGFTAEIVDDLDAARGAVLARIPTGASVMTHTSATLTETGLATAVNASGLYESARNKIAKLDRETQVREIRAIGGQPDFSLGSAHAITRDGVLLVASASGSQHAAYAYGAANVILVVGAQKLVPDADTARKRILEHSLPLESARAKDAYGQPSFIGKLLEIHREPVPGRIHIVLIRQAVGF